MKETIDNNLWGIFAEPPRLLKIFLRILPFLLIVWAYSSFSSYQTSLDSKQKVYPSIVKMSEKFGKYLLTPDKRIVANKRIKENNKIELQNDKIKLENEDRLKSNLEPLDLIPEYKRNEYKEWQKISKEIKKIDKKIKLEKANGNNINNLTIDKISLKIKSYALGIPNSLLVNDTLSSLYRLSISMIIASFSALLIGIYMGTYKTIEYTLHDFVTMFSLVQPVAILPVIMIVFGVEDYGKIIYIVIGTFPAILLGLFLKVKSIPTQTIVKAKTLGARDTQTLFKVVLPQIIPHFIDIVRLTLFLGWILLLTSEMVSSESGLGFRILLEKRFINMDVIIPYVAWIVMISFVVDRLMLQVQKKLCPWYKTR